MDTSLITTRAAAAKLGISYSKLLSMVKEKKLPFIRLGHLIRFHPVSLDEWLKEQEGK